MIARASRVAGPKVVRTAAVGRKRQQAEGRDETDQVEVGAVVERKEQEEVVDRHRRKNTVEDPPEKLLGLLPFDQPVRRP